MKISLSAFRRELRMHYRLTPATLAYPSIAELHLCRGGGKWQGPEKLEALFKASRICSMVTMMRYVENNRKWIRGTIFRRGFPTGMLIASDRRHKHAFAEVFDIFLTSQI